MRGAETSARFRQAWGARAWSQKVRRLGCGHHQVVALESHDMRRDDQSSPRSGNVAGRRCCAVGRHGAAGRPASEMRVLHELTAGPPACSAQRAPFFGFAHGRPADGAPRRDPVSTSYELFV